MLISHFLLITHAFYCCFVFPEGVILIKKEGDRNLPLKGEKDWFPFQFLNDYPSLLLEGIPKV